LAGGRNGIDAVRVPASDLEPLVSADLDMPGGQQTVVGKSAVNGADAVFLVIVPKVVE